MSSRHLRSIAGRTSDPTLPPAPVRRGTWLATASLALLLGACSPQFWGGAAVGAVGAGAVYERENRQALDKLERAFKRGEISKKEYLERKEAIEKKSVLR